MFTCLQRRHHNKAPLFWINMCSHLRGNMRQTLINFSIIALLFSTNIRVENTHSILRAQTSPTDTADQLRKKSKTIFQSKEQQSNLRSFFTAPRQFSFSQNKLQFLEVKCAQLLSTMFTKPLTHQDKVHSLLREEK